MGYKSIYICDECKKETQSDQSWAWWRVAEEGEDYVFTFCSLPCLVRYMEKHYIKTKGA